VDRFTSNQQQNKQRPILYFTDEKAFCDMVDKHQLTESVFKIKKPTM